MGTILIFTSYSSIVQNIRFFFYFLYSMKHEKGTESEMGEQVRNSGCVVSHQNSPHLNKCAVPGVT